MNRILLDSHSFLWLIFDSKKIGSDSRSKLLVADITLVSLVSIWELKIKSMLGKLKYNAPELFRGVKEVGAELLAIKEQHILGLLDVNIKDPFDKLMLTQAKYEGCHFLTADETILKLKLPFVSDVRL